MSMRGPPSAFGKLPGTDAKCFGLLN